MSPTDTAYQIRESGISISQANNKKSIETPKLHLISKVYARRTVERNPAPLGMYKNLINNVMHYQSQLACRIFEPSTELLSKKSSTPSYPVIFRILGIFSSRFSRKIHHPFIAFCWLSQATLPSTTLLPSLHFRSSPTWDQTITIPGSSGGL